MAHRSASHLLRELISRAALVLLLAITGLLLAAPALAQSDGRGNSDSAPGHSGAGNPGSSNNPHNGDGNSHCQGPRCPRTTTPPPTSPPPTTTSPPPTAPPTTAPPSTAPPRPSPSPTSTLPTESPSTTAVPPIAGRPTPPPSTAVMPTTVRSTAGSAVDPPAWAAAGLPVDQAVVVSATPWPEIRLSPDVTPHPKSPEHTEGVVTPLAVSTPHSMVQPQIPTPIPVGPGALPGFAVAGVTAVVMAARRPATRTGEFVEQSRLPKGELLDERVGVGRGDRSVTWRFPGHVELDAASRTIPPKLAPISPFLARLAGDGSEFRAMFGNLWILTPLAGIVTGLFAADSTGYVLAPPPIGLLLVGIVLASFDALSGALATAVFTGACIFGGGVIADGAPGIVNQALVLIALGFLWMSLPIVGSAVRPFRRFGTPSLRYTWDRVADLAIASMLCAWIAGQMVGAMDDFAGAATGLPGHDRLVQVVVLAAVAARIATEQVVTVLYPSRLLTVEPDDVVPDQETSSQLAGALVRTGVFGFMGYAFVGMSWQWWLGTAVFFIPQALGVLRHRFSTVSVIGRFVPRGLVEIFVLIVVCTVAIRVALDRSPSELIAARWIYLAIATPPAIIGILSVFADDDDRRSTRSWAIEMLGLGVFVATTWLALNGWEY